jgi:acetolactate synthase I/III small subunit
VQRELLLVKVKAERTRSQVIETVPLFRAKVVDVATDAVTIEATARTTSSSLLRVPRALRVTELVQSGMVRGALGSERTASPAGRRAVPTSR